MNVGSVVASRYQVLSAIGNRMFKVYDRERDTIVALRMVHWAFAARDAHVANFSAQMERARKVRHPNVRGIFEYDTSESLPYVVMEYLEAIELRQIIDADGGLPRGEAWRASIELADGLEAIHNEGLLVVEMDPQMIFRDANGTFRLDFTRDLIRQAEAPAPEQTTGRSKKFGDLAFVGPELLGGTQRPGTSSDVWGLACVVFTIFTGKPVFQGRTLREVLSELITKAPDLRGKGLPSPLVPLLASALVKDPEARLSSAREFAAGLRAARVA